MANDVLQGFNLRETPQSEQADSRQVLNNAGGYTFTVTPEQQLRRFLTLGTDSGSYYVNAKDLTTENAKLIVELAKTNHRMLVDTIVEISEGGRAPKQNPGIFALAIAASVGTEDEKRYALSQLSRVCRTGTTLFQFAKYVEQFRGWGKGLRKAVGSWYMDKPVDKLAYQAVKYRQRDGWTHWDLLRLSHPETVEDDRKDLFEWISRGTPSDRLPKVVKGYAAAQKEDADIPALVREARLPWEALPTDSLNDPKVWVALIEAGLPLGAMIRQLPRLTKLGLFEDKATLDKVVGLIKDQDYLQKSRIHPISVLIAQTTYASGVGRGQSWTPKRQIVDALDAAFYAAFGNVEPMGGRTLEALDVSGSMTWDRIANTNLTPRDMSAAMALITAATEDDYEIVAFTGGMGFRYGYNRQNAVSTEGYLTPMSISPRQRLDDVIRTVSSMRAGGTDCSLPMLWALEKKLHFDQFIIYTDNETWAGNIHAHQALQMYRQKMNVPHAKLVVVAMTPTQFTIADPSDAGMLDIAGFDSAVPNLISDFCRVSD